MVNATTSPAHYHNSVGLGWFLVNGVLVGTLCLLGIFGNILSAIIFKQRKNRLPINCILIGLAISDTILLSTAFIFITIPETLEYFEIGLTYLNGVEIQYVHIATFIVFSMAIASTSLCTVGISAERYIAVCYPLKARSISTWTTARKYVIGVITYSAFINAGRVFIYNVQTYMHGTEKKYFVGKTKYKRLVQVYTTYFPLMNFMVCIISLIFCNVKIYKEIARSNKARENLTRQQKKNIQITNMLMGIIIFFVFTNAFKIVYLITYYAFDIESLVVFYQVSNVMYVSNSAINFLIYYFKAKPFRDDFARNIARLSGSKCCLKRNEDKNERSESNFQSFSLA